jgi:hypothetical protein
MREENAATRKTVAMPKIKPVRGSVKLPSRGIAIPQIIINPAPRDAPDETPRM